MKCNLFIVVIALAMTLVVVSCGFIVPREMKQNFKYCYDGKNTGIDSLINIHGYYSMGQLRDNYGINWEREHVIDTIYTNIMFFSDGIFLYNFDDYNNDIPGLFSRAAENAKNGKKDLFYATHSWGRYIISDNKIKAQYYHMPRGLNDAWYDGEVWFKIIDRNTLKFIKVPDQKPAQKADWEGYRKEYPYFWAKFVYVDVLPTSNCKLKNKNWFWCK